MRLKCCAEDFKASDTEQGFEKINPSSFTAAFAIPLTNEIGYGKYTGTEELHVKSSNKH